MSTDSRFTTPPARPSYPQLTHARKAAIVFVAVLVSSTLLGGMLAMFQMRSEETAMARASVENAASTDGLAVRKIDSGPRG